MSIPGSQTAAVLNIYNTSNVGVPGLWVFKVDQNSIAQPGPSSMPIYYNNMHSLEQCGNDLSPSSLTTPRFSIGDLGFNNFFTIFSGRANVTQGEVVGVASFLFAPSCILL